MYESLRPSQKNTRVSDMLRKIQIDPRIRAKHNEVIDQPIVVRVTKFNDEGAKEFAENLERAHQTGQDVIPVVIDSFGGQCYSFLDMAAHMQRSTLPIHTIVEGKAMSAGAMLFAMGHTRHMAENATLMLHDVSSGAFGKIEELKADIKEADRLNSLIFRMISRNCGHKDDYFLKLIFEKGHADWFLTAKDAKKHNLCTNIGVPELTVTVSVKYAFA